MMSRIDRGTVVITVKLLQLVFFIAIISVVLVYNPKYPFQSWNSDKIEQAVIDPTKPNIVFILADDLGWNSIGYENFDMGEASSFLTNLARKGLIMNQYYAQEVCTPSRASLLTGRYPLTMGMQYGVVEPQMTTSLPLQEYTLAEALQENGYKTHLLGKWHLGHHSPRHLPTARGFDTFLGFLSGESYYWSKRYPKRTRFTDFLISNASCYTGYDGPDKHEYSTFLYRDYAIDIINNHDTSDPLFLFLSFQAVHSPFFDLNNFENGIPKEYVSESLYKHIIKNIKGRKRRQYALSLAVMDSAISSIFNALVENNMHDNTYIIFASDNGGCYDAGGKNGPLRGTKGSLFEGGSRVDSFIYSPLLPDEMQNGIYSGLMHVSDWFPTIMTLSGIDYEPDDSHRFDGYDQTEGWSTGTSPREYMLYNYFTDVSEKNFDVWINGSFAIRSMRYKLMHEFASPVYAEWYDFDEIGSNDDTLDGAECSQDSSMRSGEFTYYLFDLLEDPYETTNLYSVPNSLYFTVKSELYAQLELFRESGRFQEFSSFKSKQSFVSWKERGSYITPWVKDEDVIASYNSSSNIFGALNDDSLISKSFPMYCNSEDISRGNGIYSFDRSDYSYNSSNIEYYHDDDYFHIVMTSEDGDDDDVDSNDDDDDAMLHKYIHRGNSTNNDDNEGNDDNGNDNDDDNDDDNVDDDSDSGDDDNDDDNDDNEDDDNDDDKYTDDDDKDTDDDDNDDENNDNNMESILSKDKKINKNK